MPRSLERRPMRLRLENQIEWHSKCNRLYSHSALISVFSCCAGGLVLVEQPHQGHGYGCQRVAVYYSDSCMPEPRVSVWRPHSSLCYHSFTRVIWLVSSSLTNQTFSFASYKRRLDVTIGSLLQKSPIRIGLLSKRNTLFCRTRRILRNPMGWLWLIESTWASKNHPCVCVRMCVWCVCVCVCAFVCTNVNIHNYIYMNIMHLSVDMYVCMCVCAYK